MMSVLSRFPQGSLIRRFPRHRFPPYDLGAETVIQPNYHFSLLSELADAVDVSGRGVAQFASGITSAHGYVWTAPVWQGLF